MTSSPTGLIEYIPSSTASHVMSLDSRTVPCPPPTNCCFQHWLSKDGTKNPVKENYTSYIGSNGLGHRMKNHVMTDDIIFPTKTRGETATP